MSPTLGFDDEKRCIRWLVRVPNPGDEQRRLARSLAAALALVECYQEQGRIDEAIGVLQQTGRRR